MQTTKYIKDLSVSYTVSVSADSCMNTNKAHRSDILLFSRNKVLEPFAPYNL
ncbi:MAG: hypothetical protein ABIP98_04385 [Ginsengibacter sp.]